MALAQLCLLVLDRPFAVFADPPSAIVEHHARRALDRRRHNRRRPQRPVLHVRPYPAQAQRLQRLLQRRRIEETPHASPRQQERREFRQLRRRQQRPQHLVPRQLRPQLARLRQRALDAFARRRREERRVDRSDARPHDHLYAFAAPLQRRQQHR